MEFSIFILIIGSLLLLLFVSLLIIGKFIRSLEKKMLLFEKKMVGTDVEKVRKHQDNIENLYSKINQKYFKIEKNQDDLVKDIKKFSQNNFDYNSLQGDMKSTYNRLESLEMKIDDLLKERDIRNSISVNNTYLTEIKSDVKELIRKIDLNNVNIKPKTAVSLNGDEEQQTATSDGLTSHIKSLFLDTNKLKNHLLSKDSKWNVKQVEVMFSSLLESISEMEQNIVTDLYKQSNNAVTLNENYKYMEEKIVDIHQMMKYTQSFTNEYSTEIKKDLENIARFVSPLQSNVMHSLNESIRELNAIREDMKYSDNLSSSGKVSGSEYMIIKESLDALSEYISISQQQLFNVLNYNNENLSAENKKVLKLIENNQKNLKGSEDKLINYLSFIYKAVESQTNKNMDMTLIKKIENLRSSIDDQKAESQKYFTTLYKTLT
ncbi:hypothetical protein [Oceanobacillus kapialis]|uniref:hypothetical protein n=1 Tax=Oceanobacillus kapialis TaxID=481353 RepID=UPI00384D1C81